MSAYRLMVLALGLFLTAFATSQVNAALIAHYKFDGDLKDEISGTYLTLTSGNYAFGLDQDGNQNSAIVSVDYDPETSGLVNLVTNSPPPFTVNRTVCYWVKVQYIVSSGVSIKEPGGSLTTFYSQPLYGHHWTIWYLWQPAADVRSSNIERAAVPEPDEVIVSDEFVHICGVHDEQSGSIYINGSVYPSDSDGVNSYNDQQSLTIQFTRYDSIADLRIYDEALTADQISELANASPTPSISSISPTSGAVGSTVTILGSNFGDTQDSSTVTFGSTEASVSAWSDTQIQAQVPSLAAGTYDVVVNTAAGSSNAFSFEVLAEPGLSLSPSSLDFGQVTVNESQNQDFTIENTGSGTLTGTAATDPPFSVVSGNSFNIAAGENQTATVQFAPTTEGTFAGNVTVDSNAPDSPHSVVLTGTGTASVPEVPTLKVTPSTSLNFTAEVGEPVDFPVVVHNIGGGTLDGDCTIVEATIKAFTVTGCPFSLPQGQSTELIVTFSPTQKGKIPGKLSITTNGGSSTVELVGEAKASKESSLKLYFSNDPDPHPFYIYYEYTRRDATAINADVTVHNSTPTWYQVDAEFGQPTTGASQPVDIKDTNFLVGPYGDKLIRNVNFADGQYLHYKVNPNTFAASAVYLIDAASRIFLGLPLPADARAISQKTALEALKTITDNCSAELVAIGLEASAGNKLGVLQNSAEALICASKLSAKNLTALVKFIRTVFGQKNSVLFADEFLKIQQIGANNVAGLFRIPLVVELVDGKLRYTEEGYVRLEARP